VTRKDSLRKLTQEHCDNLRTTRLEEYKKKLDKEKELFQKEKAEILAWIAEQERACGVVPSSDLSSADINSSR
jgi:small subunit ribosomal protein S15